MIKYDFKNKDKVKKTLEKELAAKRKERRKVMRQGCMFLASKVTSKMIHSPRGGRTYKRGGKLHKASAPGEPPAVDTGQLIHSVDYNIVNKKEQTTGKVGVMKRDVAKQAEALEYGTSKMRARPFLFNTLAEFEHELSKMFYVYAKKRP